MMAIFLSFGLFWASQGCKRSEPADQHTRLFSDGSIAFVMETSKDASHAVVFRFEADTDGDGTTAARFGDHGELEGDQPTITWIDTRTNAFKVYDTYLGANVGRSHFLFSSGSALVVVNGSTGKETRFEDFDPGPQTDLCRRPENADVSSDGRRVVYRTSTGFNDVSLVNAAVEKHDVNGVVGVNAGDGFTMIKRVTTDTNGDGKITPPKSLGSCPCWWCLRFARSVGRYKVEGDVPTMERWSDGKGEVVDSRTTLGWGETAMAEGCKRFGDAHRDRYFLIRCGTEWKTLDTKTGEQKAVSAKVSIPEPGLRVGIYVPAITASGREKQIATVRLDSGEVQTGPAFEQSRKPNDSGWWLGRDKTGPFIFQMQSGRRTPLSEPSFDIEDKWVTASEKTYAVNPLSGAVEQFDFEVESTHTNGCVVDRTAAKFPKRGPFELVCP